jgi:hypothetical protein
MFLLQSLVRRLRCYQHTKSNTLYYIIYLFIVYFYLYGLETGRQRLATGCWKTVFGTRKVKVTEK